MTNKLKIGLALSGGGIRAAIFHLGILKNLAERQLLESVASISSVSGASLGIGLILAHNSLKWPSSTEYLQKVLPEITETILKTDIQKAAILRLPFYPQYWIDRVKLMAKVIEDKWGVYGTLQELPSQPYWEINCTTFETGKNFRIRKDYMGDYKTGYTLKPALNISEAIASSAGFPALIGPYTINTDSYQWFSDKSGQKPIVPLSAKYHLWDGGVYDNLGLEALFKPDKGLDREINYLIVCNASTSLEIANRDRDISAKNLMRLLNIAMDQVNALRSREVFAGVVNNGHGSYIKIGNSAEHILAGSTLLTEDEKKLLIKECMTPDEAIRAANYATTLRTPTRADFALLLNHGYENAKCTAAACAISTGD